MRVPKWLRNLLQRPAPALDPSGGPPAMADDADRMEADVRSTPEAAEPTAASSVTDAALPVDAAEPPVAPSAPAPATAPTAEGPDSNPAVADAPLAPSSSADTYAEPVELRGHDGPVVAAGWSPDGARILTASEDGTARVWDAASGSELAILRGHKRWLTAAAWSACGGRIATAEPEGVKLWDARTYAPQADLAVEDGGLVTAVAWSPDGRCLATGSFDCRTRIWHADSAALLVELEGFGSRVTDVAWSSDGLRLAAASMDVAVWDRITGNLRAHVELYAIHDWCVGWSPDGRHVAAAFSETEALIWDVDNDSEVARLAGHLGQVLGASWSPDGSRILTWSEDGTARVWDPAGAELAGMVGHEPGWYIVAARWSPDGRRIATAGGDGTARVWDSATGQQCAVLHLPESTLRSVAWSPDGRRLLAAKDDSALVWCPAAGAPVEPAASTADPRYTSAFAARQWWRSAAAARSASRGYAICDRCNGKIPFGHGHLCRPVRHGDIAPDLLCADCFGRSPQAAWTEAGEAAPLPATSGSPLRCSSCGKSLGEAVTSMSETQVYAGAEALASIVSDFRQRAVRCEACGTDFCAECSVKAAIGIGKTVPVCPRCRRELSLT